MTLYLKAKQRRNMDTIKNKQKLHNINPALRFSKTNLANIPNWLAVRKKNRTLKFHLSNKIREKANSVINQDQEEKSPGFSKFLRMKRFNYLTISAIPS